MVPADLRRPLWAGTASFCAYVALEVAAAWGKNKVLRKKQ
jgi:hypothetical protein